MVCPAVQKNEILFQNFYATGAPNRCPVMIFKAFIKHRPEVMKNESDPFYLGVIHQPRSNIWFKTIANWVNDLFVQL